MTNQELDEAQRIKDVLLEAANDDCECCQWETLKSIRGNDFSRYLRFEVDGKHARIEYTCQLTNENIRVINRPSIKSNHLTGDNKLHDDKL